MKDRGTIKRQGKADVLADLLKGPHKIDYCKQLRTDILPALVSTARRICFSILRVCSVRAAVRWRGRKVKGEMVKGKNRSLH
jgi:hypothetical protein